MTRYTSSDIEIHLSDLTSGMDANGVDVLESNRKAADLVRQAIRQCYPQYDVTVYTQQTQGRWFDAAGYPNDVEPEVLEQVASDALGEDGSLWTVEESTPEAPKMEWNEGAQVWVGETQDGYRVEVDGDELSEAVADAVRDGGEPDALYYAEEWATLRDVENPHVRIAKVKGTLAEILAHEVQAEAHIGDYTVVVSEYDDFDPVDHEPYRYTLTVSAGAMPPHATHFFTSLDEVHAYIASGAVLTLTADYDGWRATEGEG